MDLVAATGSGLVFVGEEEGALFEDSSVSALAWDGNALLAVVDRHALYRIEDREPQGSAVSDLRLNCVHAHDGEVWVGAEQASLLRLTDGRFEGVESFEDAPGRDEWFTPWGGPPDVRSIASLLDGTLFVNVHVGGILRSGDGGETWEQTIDIGNDVHEVTGSHPLVAAGATGIAISLDGGGTWTIANEGLHATYCRAAAVSGDDLYVTASVGPHGGRSALYKMPVGGDRLEKCSRGLPDWFGDNIDTGCLTVSGDQVAFGTSDGSIFASEDRGETWRRLAEDLAPIHWLEAVPLTTGA